MSKNSTYVRLLHIKQKYLLLSHILRYNQIVFTLYESLFFFWLKRKHFVINHMHYCFDWSWTLECAWCEAKNINIPSMHGEKKREKKNYCIFRPFCMFWRMECKHIYLLWAISDVEYYTRWIPECVREFWCLSGIPNNKIKNAK